MADDIQLADLITQAEGGSVEAMRRLGRIYGGLEDRDPDPGEAFHWLTRAVEAGDDTSLSDLGLHIFNGWGTEADEPRGAALYLRAAETGDLWAAYLLGLCYAEGAGVEIDKTAALHWLDKAAEEHREARDMAYLVRWGGD